MRIAFSVLVTLLFAGKGSGQSILGEIRGTVRDASGALVADAVVLAALSGTGEQRKTATDSEGSFVFANLNAGTYEVRIDKQGFCPALTRNAVLRAREIVQILRRKVWRTPDREACRLA